MNELENLKLADEFAVKGTVKHFMLRLGFMPHDEKEAEQIIINIIEEWEKLTYELSSLKEHLHS